MSEKLREFIWERCEMDDHKTDEIIKAILNLLPGEKDLPIQPLLASPEGWAEFLHKRSMAMGYNAYRKELLEKLGGGK